MRVHTVAALVPLLVATSLSAQSRRFVSFEGTLFSGAPPSGSPAHELALVVRSQHGLRFDAGSQRLTAVPFVRLDVAGGGRTRIDFQELSWQAVWRRWAFRVGLSQVHWGVAESRSLVDIINQRELVEGHAEYVKLGQPMINVSGSGDWGQIGLYLLPWFRERPGRGRAAMTWSAWPVRYDRAVYESNNRHRHLDWAVRWSRRFGAWDVAISHFSGTNREPRFVEDRTDAVTAFLAPHYDLIDRTGAELQWISGGWIWKLEAVAERGGPAAFAAAVGGFEYAFADYLSVLLEYTYDSRGHQATTSVQDDLYAGARLLLPDGAIHGGVFIDRQSRNVIGQLELTRRLNDELTVGVEGRAFVGRSALEPRFAARRSSFLAVKINRYF